MADHTHRWRATTKIFALVCDCGVVYHDWLLDEVERLRKSAASSDEATLREMALSEDLAIARQEIIGLRAIIDEAKHELEAGAADINVLLSQ